MSQQERTIKITTQEEQLWENLTISNSFIFEKVIQNPELCKEMLERLMDIPVEHIEYPNDSKNKCLHVYLRNSKETMCYVVIQLINNGTPAQLSQRVRYYQEAIDLEAFAQGISYDELPNSYVVVVCTFDVFGLDLQKYTFENKCKENNVSLNDGTAIVFFNTSGAKGDISKDTENILKFIEDNAVRDDFTERLAQEVQKIKKEQEYQIEYMALQLYNS